MIGESRERGSARCRTKYTVVVGEGQRKPTVAGEAVCVCVERKRERKRDMRKGTRGDGKRNDDVHRVFRYSRVASRSWIL